MVIKLQYTAIQIKILPLKVKLKKKYTMSKSMKYSTKKSIASFMAVWVALGSTPKNTLSRGEICMANFIPPANGVSQCSYFQAKIQKTAAISPVLRLFRSKFVTDRQTDRQIL